MAVPSAKQLRVRIPDDIWLRLGLENAPSRNEALVAHLRQYITQRSEAQQAHNANVVVRALATVFSAAEIVTGKRAPMDPDTLRVALTMVGGLTKQMSDELSSRLTNPNRTDENARRALGILTSIARLSREHQTAFSAAWTAVA